MAQADIDDGIKDGLTSAEQDELVQQAIRMGGGWTRSDPSACDCEKLRLVRMDVVRQHGVPN